MKKIISIILILIVVSNMLLFAFGRINDLFFWIVIIICAIFAYKLVPKLK